MTTVESVRIQCAVNRRRKRVRHYVIAALGCLASACIAGALLWGLVS